MVEHIAIHTLTTVLLFYVIVFQFEGLDWLLELVGPSELLIGLRKKLVFVIWILVKVILIL